MAHTPDETKDRHHQHSMVLVPIDFLPFKTISLPSMSAVACILVASLDATSGSVIQKTERIFPIIFMAHTPDETKDRHHQHSMVLVPIDTAGVEIQRMKRPCAISKPCPAPPIKFSIGTRTLLK
jgi:hypothetical protein